MDLDKLLAVYSHMWTEEKDDWVIYELTDNEIFVRYAIFNREKSIETKMRNPKDTKPFVDYLVSKGIPVIIKEIDTFYEEDFD